MKGEETVIEAQAIRGKYSARGKRHWRLRTFAPVIALVCLSTITTILNPRFMTVTNFWNIANQTSIILVLGVGMTFVILMGSIDLSIEGIMALTSVIISLLVANSANSNNFGVWGVLAGLAVGTMMGFVNGIVYVKVRIPSLMVTLGMWSIGLGLATILNQGVNIRIEDPGVRALALHSTLGLPNLAWVAMGVLLVGLFIQRYTRLGRYAYAIGGGEDLAKLSGVPVGRYKVLIFTMAGFFAGIGGLLTAARLGVGTAQVGEGTLFAVITAVVLGGTALTGSAGGVVQTLVGVLTVVVLNNAMILTGIHPYIQQGVQGVIIVIAVALTIDRTRILIMK